jgi:pyrroloquinoline quinone (PQQ) biosynthesis protein C
MQTLDSWQLIHSGDASHFVTALCREASEHPAVHHPYLKRLASGDLPDMEFALRDYAFQYSFYGAEFPSYLEGVIGGLRYPRHREVLCENLVEEKGKPGSTELADRPHTELFKHFQIATGVDAAYLARAEPCTTALVWRDLFLQKCQSRQEGVGLGGIGIATELVVPTMYSYILDGIRRHSTLTAEESFFFELHAQCDSRHGNDLREITQELSEKIDCREAVRFGVFSSLNLRKAFWDIMLSRAVARAH